jgi:hypothetical protein
MHKTLARLASIAGAILIAVASSMALVCLFGAVWMHAPLIPALYVTLLMTAPPFLLGWALLRTGRPPARAWYRVTPDGKLARQGAHDV